MLPLCMLLVSSSQRSLVEIKQDWLLTSLFCWGRYLHGTMCWKYLCAIVLLSNVTRQPFYFCSDPNSSQVFRVFHCKLFHFSYIWLIDMFQLLSFLRAWSVQYSICSLDFPLKWSWYLLLLARSVTVISKNLCLSNSGKIKLNVKIQVVFSFLFLGRSREYLSHTWTNILKWRRWRGSSYRDWLWNFHVFRGCYLLELQIGNETHHGEHKRGGCVLHPAGNGKE